VYVRLVYRMLVLCVCLSAEELRVVVMKIIHDRYVCVYLCVCVCVYVCMCVIE
jgi:hypothetical protein